MCFYTTTSPTKPLDNCPLLWFCMDAHRPRSGEPSLPQNLDAVGKSSPNTRTGHHTKILILCFVHSRLTFFLSKTTGTEEEDGDSMNEQPTRWMNVRVVLRSLSPVFPLAETSRCSCSVFLCCLSTSFWKILVQSDTASHFIYMYNQM